MRFLQGLSYINVKLPQRDQLSRRDKKSDWLKIQPIRKSKEQKHHYREKNMDMAILSNITL